MRSKMTKEMPIGTERICDTKRGFTLIKISNEGMTRGYRGTWERKHIFLWKQQNGTVPEGYNVIFLDGNKSNFELDNLAIATRNEICLLHRFKLQFDDKKSTKAGLAIVRHKIKIANLVKKQYGHISYYKYTTNNKKVENNIAAIINEKVIKRIPKRSKYTPEIIRFIKDNAENVSEKELSELVNKRFGITTTNDKISNIKYIYGIKGRGRCGSGKHSRAPLYSEVKNSGGYILIKISNEGRYSQKWVKKNKWIWEQAHGKIPAGHKIIFLDHNKDNCALENLMCVSEKIMGYMAQYNLFSNDPKQTKAGIVIAKRRMTSVEKIKAGKAKLNQGEVKNAP